MKLAGAAPLVWGLLLGCSPPVATAPPANAQSEVVKPQQEGAEPKGPAGSSLESTSAPAALPLCDRTLAGCQPLLEAEQLLDAGQASEAQALIQPLLADEDGLTPLRRALYGQAVLENDSLAYGAGGQEAARAYEILVEVARTPGLDAPLRARVELQEARALLSLGRGREGLPLLQRLVEAAPQDAERQAALGIAYLSVGQVPRSLGPLAKAARLDPKQPERHIVLGTARMLVGDYGQAERSFRAAIALDGSSARAHGDLGTLLLLKGNAKSGKQHLQRAAFLEPKKATYAANLAYAELLSERPQQALEQAKKSIELDPRLASAWLNQGLAQVALGQRDEARLSFEKAAALDPTDPRPQNNLRDLDELEAEGKKDP